MGGYTSKLTSYMFEPPEYRIVIIGLYRAGKTSALIRWTPHNDHSSKFFDAVDRVRPTIGFNLESIKLENMKLTFWDIGGEKNARPMWFHYFANTQAIVYVVDSQDTAQFEEVKNVLDFVLADAQLKGVPLLVLANKQDLSEAVSPVDLTEILHLQEIKDREWKIFGTCAHTGEGFYESFMWLKEKLSS